jgi:hypothetical protein
VCPQATDAHRLPRIVRDGKPIQQNRETAAQLALIRPQYLVQGARSQIVRVMNHERWVVDDTWPPIDYTRDPAELAQIAVGASVREAPIGNLPERHAEGRYSQRR